MSYGYLNDRDIVYGDSAEGQQDEKNANIIDSMTLGLTGIGARNQREAATNVMRSVDLPTYDMNAQFVAPDYAGDFNPAMYGMPEDATATMANESPEGRAAMLEALQQMGRQTDQAVGSQQDLDRVRGMNDAAQFAQGREGMIRQDAMRRGQVGGAADMIGRQVAAQAAANRNQEGGLQSAQMAALQRLAGTQAQGGLAGQLRSGDQALAFRNQDAINQFNMGNVAARNAARMANTQLGNTAGMRNLDARQMHGNQRADATNRSLSRRDDLMGQQFSQGMQQAGGVANALTGQAVGGEGTSKNQQESARDLMRMFGAGFSGGGGK
jgi:hypothetical protein